MLRASYDERRKLERDLHDGAQQRLVALGMRLRVLQIRGSVAPSVSAELDAAVTELGVVLTELRRVAHGVRPSALDDGLAAALAGIARSCDDVVELQIHVGELPDAVATTAYYVVSESVANALKHSDAGRIRVLVDQEQGYLRVCVSDDGEGGARPSWNGGLTALSDRVAALGGTFNVRSAIGAGTEIEVVLPCES